MSKQKKKATGGKMTEEEMALYLQTQKEMDLRKEQTVTQFLKDKLQEDERSTVMWLQRLNEGWRTLFRFCETEEQRTQIVVLKQTWERQLDGINSCIKDMADELREKERHSAQVHHCHLMHISRLSKLQKKRMGVLQQERELSMEKIKKYYTLQRKQMLSEDSLQLLNLEDTLPSIHNKYADLLRETVSCFSSRMESYEKTFHDKRENLVKKRRGQLREHQQVLETRRQELEVVTSKNKCCREALDQAAKKLENERKKLMPLQAKHLLDENGEAKVKEQLADAEKQNQKLRTKVERSRARARKSLTELTIQSDKAAKNLKSIIAQGERVLRMAMLCKSMEDRLLMTKQLQNILVENLDTEDIVVQFEKCVFPELSLLTCLHNEAKAQRSALRQRRNALRCQNEQMRRQIQDMKHQRDNMEVRGGTDCRPSNNTRSDMAQGHCIVTLGSSGHGSPKLITPVRCSTPGHSSPPSLCPKLTASPELTCQGTAHPHFDHKI